MKLTETDQDIIENSATGICVRGVWKWHRNGEWVTRQVNSLLRAGLVKAVYYTGGKASTYKA